MATNVLTNPGFEDGMENWNTGSLEAEISSSEVHSGSKSFVFDLTKDAAHEETLELKSDRMPVSGVKAGSEMVFGAYFYRSSGFKSTEEFPCVLEARLYDKDGNLITKRTTNKFKIDWDDRWAKVDNKSLGHAWTGYSAIASVEWIFRLTGYDEAFYIDDTYFELDLEAAGPATIEKIEPNQTEVKAGDSFKVNLTYSSTDAPLTDAVCGIEDGSTQTLVIQGTHSSEVLEFSMSINENAGLGDKKITLELKDRSDPTTVYDTGEASIKVVETVVEKDIEITSIIITPTQAEVGDTIEVKVKIKANADKTAYVECSLENEKKHETRQMFDGQTRDLTFTFVIPETDKTSLPINVTVKDGSASGTLIDSDSKDVGIGERQLPDDEIDASLDAPEVEPLPVLPGERVIVMSTLVNRGTKTHEFVVGASAKPTNFGWSDIDKVVDLPWTKVTLDPEGETQSNPISLPLDIPADAKENDEWDVRMRVWEGADGGTITTDYPGISHTLYVGGELGPPPKPFITERDSVFDVGEGPSPDEEESDAPLIEGEGEGIGWFGNLLQTILGFLSGALGLALSRDPDVYTKYNVMQYPITGRDLTTPAELKDWLEEFKDLSEFFFQGANVLYVPTLGKNIRGEPQVELTLNDWIAAAIWWAGGARHGYKPAAKILTKNLGAGNSLKNVNQGLLKMRMAERAADPAYMGRWYKGLTGLQTIGFSPPSGFLPSFAGRNLALQIIKRTPKIAAPAAAGLLSTVSKNIVKKGIQNPWFPIFVFSQAYENLYAWPKFWRADLEKRLSTQYKDLDYRNDKLLSEIEWGMMDATAESDYLAIVPKLQELEENINVMTEELTTPGPTREAILEVFPGAERMLSQLQQSLAQNIEGVRDLAGLPAVVSDSVLGKVTGIRDGDTIEVEYTKVDPFGELEDTQVMDVVRLKGVYAPEIDIGSEVSKLAGRVCKVYLEEILPIGSNVEIFWDPRIPRDTYGRILGDVTKKTPERDVSIGYEMRQCMPGEIRLYSKPTRAAVYISGRPFFDDDGEKHFLGDEAAEDLFVGITGGVVRDIPPGEYTLVLRAGKFEEYVVPEKALVPPNARLDIPGTFELEPLEKFGSVSITSTPTGADIHVQEAGGTPIFSNRTTNATLDLKPGEYRIFLELEDYEPWGTADVERYEPEGFFTVVANELLDLPNAELVRTPVDAEFEINSRPSGARIHIFGAETDFTTNRTLSFTEDQMDWDERTEKYRVNLKLTLKDYKDEERLVELELGKKRTIDFTLTKLDELDGSLKITATPTTTKFRILVDDEAKNLLTPRTFDVLAGEHDITLEHDDFASKTTYGVVVLAGKTTDVHFDMEEVETLASVNVKAVDKATGNTIRAFVSATKVGGES